MEGERENSTFFDRSLMEKYYESVVLREFSEKWIKSLTKSLDKFNLEQYLSYLNNGDGIWLEEFRNADNTLPMPVGLENLGATCYVNVLIQALFQSHHFRKIIYSAISNTFPNDVWSQLQSLFIQMQFTNRKWINPEPFISTMAINTRVQQDTPEFFKNLLSKLQACMRNNGAIQKRLKQAFSGESVYINTCMNCSNSTTTRSEFHELDLFIRGKKSLIEALKFFSDWELIQDAFCSHCKKHVCIKRCSQISTLPPILTVQLLRYTYQEDRAKKIQSNFSFPLSLKATRNGLDGFDFESIIDEDNQENCFEVVIDSFDPAVPRPESHSNGSHSNESFTYNLSAVLVHRGNSASSGHYIAYIFNRSINAWIKMDDKYVSKLVIPNNQNVNSSFMKCAKDAYMLMYTREDVQELDKDEVDFDNIINDIQDVGGDNGLDMVKQIKDVVLKENEEIQARMNDLKERRDELQNELNNMKSMKVNLLNLFAKLKVPDLSAVNWIQKKDFSDWFLFKKRLDSVKEAEVDAVKCPHGRIDSFENIWIPLINGFEDIHSSFVCNSNDFCNICLQDYLSESEKKTLISSRYVSFNSLRRGKKSKNAELFLIQSQWVQQYFKSHENIDFSSPFYSLTWAGSGILCEHHLRDPRVDTISVHLPIIELLKSFTHPDAGETYLIPSDTEICHECWDRMEEELIVAKTTDEYVYIKLLHDDLVRSQVKDDYFDSQIEEVVDSESFRMLPLGFMLEVEKFLKNPLLNHTTLEALHGKYSSDSAVVESDEQQGLVCEKHGLSNIDLKVCLDWRTSKKRYFIFNDEIFNHEHFGQAIMNISVGVVYDASKRAFEHSPQVCKECSDAIVSQLVEKYYVIVKESSGSDSRSLGDSSIDDSMNRKSKRRRLTNPEFKVPLIYGDNLITFQLRIMEIKGYPPLCQKLELMTNDPVGKGKTGDKGSSSIVSEVDSDVINLVDEVLESNEKGGNRVIDTDERFLELVKPFCKVSLRIIEQNFDHLLLEDQTS